MPRVGNSLGCIPAGPRRVHVAKASIAGNHIRPALLDRGVLAVPYLNARKADLDEGARLLLLQETLTAQEFPAIRPQGKALERKLQKTA
jgi:hypothetical protein